MHNLLQENTFKKKLLWYCNVIVFISCILKNISTIEAHSIYDRNGDIRIAKQTNLIKHEIVIYQMQFHNNLKAFKDDQIIDDTKNKGISIILRRNIRKRRFIPEAEKKYIAATLEYIGEKIKNWSLQTKLIVGAIIILIFINLICCLKKPLDCLCVYPYYFVMFIAKFVTCPCGVYIYLTRRRPQKKKELMVIKSKAAEVV